jgi:hypothetical protein
MVGKVSRRGFLTSAVQAALGAAGAKLTDGGNQNQEDSIDWKAKFEEYYQQWQDSCDDMWFIVEHQDEHIKHLLALLVERDAEIDALYSNYDAVGEACLEYKSHIHNLTECVNRQDIEIAEQHQEILALEKQLYDGDAVEYEDVVDAFPDDYNMPYMPCDTSRLDEFSGTDQVIKSGYIDGHIVGPYHIHTAFADAFPTAAGWASAKIAWVSAKIEDVAYVPEASDDQT